MVEVEKVIRELSDSKQNQHCGFVDGIGNVYAVSEETLNNALELLKEYELLKDQNVRLIQQKKELTQRITRLQEEKAYSSRGIYDPWEGE